MDWSSDFDVSSFFLLEGSGDSEAECSFVLAVDEKYVVMDEDDAESCCGSSCDDILLGKCSDADGKDYDGNYHAWIHGCWSCEKVVFTYLLSEIVCSSEERDSGVVIDTSRMMTKLDDKQFWETCLSMGY